MGRKELFAGLALGLAACSPQGGEICRTDQTVTGQANEIERLARARVLEDGDGANIIGEVRLCRTEALTLALDRIDNVRINPSRNVAEIANRIYTQRAIQAALDVRETEAPTIDDILYSDEPET